MKVVAKNGDLKALEKIMVVHFYIYTLEDKKVPGNKAGSKTIRSRKMGICK